MLGFEGFHLLGSYYLHFQPHIATDNIFKVALATLSIIRWPLTFADFFDLE